MSKNKCIIILSEKSSGSTVLQDLIVDTVGAKHVAKTRHCENETLFWTKAASVLGRPQVKMIDSEVPIAQRRARRDLLKLLSDNVKGYVPPLRDEELVFDGWKALCVAHEPIFVEKSPHHLCQVSVLELIVEAMSANDEMDFLLVGLVRNPMDTLYSQYMRWSSPPEKVQFQWEEAYKNLLSLKRRLGDKVVIVRYEDIVVSSRALTPVFEFCGVPVPTREQRRLHSRSLAKWKTDKHFGFVLEPRVSALATQYGYEPQDLENEPSFLWPLRRWAYRSARLSVRPFYGLAQRMRGVC